MQQQNIVDDLYGLQQIAGADGIAPLSRVTSPISNDMLGGSAGGAFPLSRVTEAQYRAGADSVGTLPLSRGFGGGKVTDCASSGVGGFLPEGRFVL